ncbi:MAG: helix-turn-helix domain-containing protein [Planctomycetia bacterium]|nr:helix-turn-helix domain-containing protein [Planctomycetia bacterium]
MKIVKDDNNLLNMDEVSSLLGIKKATLYDYCMRRQITCVKIGKLNRFRMSDIQDFINKRIVEKVN